MRILLDTHIYLWVLTDDKMLSAKARDILYSSSEIYISSASIWEAAIKIKLKKLKADLNLLVTSIGASGFIELPITSEHALALDELPEIHNDPFDRILIAQAITEPLKLITSDKLLKDYSALVEIV